MFSGKFRLVTILIISGFFLFTTFYAPTVIAKTNVLTTKPGWGLGDFNHIHTGPPGQSVRPHQVNNTNVSIQVNANTNTGGNSVQGNTDGPVSLIIGAVTNTFSFVIETGSNILNLL